MAHTFSVPYVAEAIEIKEHFLMICLELEVNKFCPRKFYFIFKKYSTRLSMKNFGTPRNISSSKIPTIRP